MSPASVVEGFYPRRMTLWSDVIPEIRRQHCPDKKQPDILVGSGAALFERRFALVIFILILLRWIDEEV
jgi:hypothetical protein